MPIARHRKAGSFTMLVMGLIFAVVGGCVSWFMGSDTTLTCRRSTDTCILEKTSMSGRKEVTASLPLSRLKSAGVESRKGSTRKKNRRGKPTYQVVLHTDDGTIPFSNVWTSGQKAHEQSASDINTYLKSSRESLSIVQSGKTVRIFGYLFFAAGFLLLLGGLWGMIKIFMGVGIALSGRG